MRIIAPAALVLFSTVMFLPTNALADPPLIPAPPPVFCFAKTGADAINNNNGIRIQFEVLNWTGQTAHFLQIDANTNPTISTGVNTAGANQMFSATTPATLTGPFVGKARTNDWLVDTDSATSVKWAAGTPLVSGNPNLPPTPIDSGNNTLDGFILDLPFLGELERVVFDWAFLGADMAQLAGDFAFGAFQIDRATNGPNDAIRQSDFVAIAFASSEINPETAPPLNPEETERHARMDPSVGSNVVPLPATAWLLIGSLGALGALRTRARAKLA